MATFASTARQEGQTVAVRRGRDEAGERGRPLPQREPSATVGTSDLGIIRLGPALSLVREGVRRPGVRRSRLAALGRRPILPPCARASRPAPPAFAAWRSPAVAGRLASLCGSARASRTSLHSLFATSPLGPHSRDRRYGRRFRCAVGGYEQDADLVPLGLLGRLEFSNAGDLVSGT